MIKNVLGRIWERKKERQRERREGGKIWVILDVLKINNKKNILITSSLC